MDRVPGFVNIRRTQQLPSDCAFDTRHPYSVDTLCALPPSLQSSDSIILTGSSDGLLRAVQLQPSKFIGIIAEHGDFPIERIAIDHGGDGKWVGSIGHEATVKMTDLKAVLGGIEGHSSAVEGARDEKTENEEICDADSDEAGDNEDEHSEDESSIQTDRKRKRKQGKDLFAGKKKKGRNQVDADVSFFAEL